MDKAGRRVRYLRVVEMDSEADRPAPSTAEDREARETLGSTEGESGGRRTLDSATQPIPSAAGDDREGPREVEVAYRDLMRGYEVDGDRIVTLEPEEIERARKLVSQRG